MEKIKIAGVSYLNTKPFLFGINRLLFDQATLTVEYPAKIAGQLKSHEVDIALVPVSTLAEVENARIISDFCIGCNGPVGSVVICSEVPIEKAASVYLDYHSRTSVQLTHVLLKKFLRLNPHFIFSEPGYEQQVQGTSAGLFIGDRALSVKKKYPFVYDLGELWKQQTSMPFVFACWATVINITPDFESAFNNALTDGIANLDKVISEEQPLFPDIDVRDYLANKIQYDFDEAKQKALEYFYQICNEIK